MLFQPLPFRDYVPCKLTQGQIWYISFSVVNPETGKLKRFRVKCNRTRNIRDRRKLVQTMMAGINERLALGWNPFIESSSPKSYTKLFDALDTFLAVKKKESEEGTMRSYRSYIKAFRHWLSHNGYGPESYSCCITKEVAIGYMDDLESDDDISPRTYNNYLAFMRILFSWMISKGYTSDNHFDAITKKSKKLTKKNRRMLTDRELLTLFGYLRENNKEYLAVCILCYCCFMRPKEIALLKCRDIDLRAQTVHVDASIAKNDNDSYRTIPDDILPIFSALDLSHPDLYVFGQHDDYDFTPGRKLVGSRKLAKYWSDYVREACHFPMEVKFYSLKDTGITNMASANVPINIVQQQADHSSLSMTSVYVGKTAQAKEALKKVDILPKAKTH